MKRQIKWSGEIKISARKMDRSDYDKYIDTRYISYKCMEVLLRDGKGKHTKYYVPVSLLKDKYVGDIFNQVVFKTKYRQPDQPPIETRIDCFEDGKRIEFDTLPIIDKTWIVQNIIEGQTIGKMYIHE